MSTPDHVASAPPDQDSVSNPAPDVAATSGVRAEAPVVEGTASQRGDSDVIFVVLLGVPTVVALLLLLVIFPIWDGKKARVSARETFGELHSLSYTAGWEVDSEIYSAQASLESDLASVDSGLWSVGFNLGSLASDVGAESRPAVRELEGAIGASRNELRLLRSSVGARFDQLRDGVEARLGGIEQTADAALDDEWDDSSRRFSRDTRIVLGWMSMLVSVPLVYGLVLLWAGWRESRAVAQPDGGM